MVPEKRDPQRVLKPGGDPETLELTPVPGEAGRHGDSSGMRYVYCNNLMQ